MVIRKVRQQRSLLARTSVCLSCPHTNSLRSQTATPLCASAQLTRESKERDSLIRDVAMINSQRGPSGLSAAETVDNVSLHKKT